MVYVVLFAFNSPSFSNAGDENIAGFLSSLVEPGYFFINPLLAYPLRWLYLLIPCISWWLFFSLSAIFVFCFVCCFWIESIIVDRMLRYLTLFAFLTAFWFGIGEEAINFTQTSSMYTIAGMLLLWWYGFFMDRRKKVVAVMGSILTMLGWLVRWKASAICLSFGAVVGGWFILQSVYRQKVSVKNRICIQRIMKENIGTMVLFGCSIISVAAMLAYGVADKEWREYYLSNSLRESVYDYYSQYPVYSQNIELYKSRNISASMMEMIRKNFTADMNYFNSEVLKSISSLKNDNRITVGQVNKVLEVFWEKPIVILSILLIVLSILLKRKRASIPILLQTCMLLLCGGYLAYIGRVSWRVVIGILLSYMINCIVITAKNEERIIRLPTWSQKLVWIGSAVIIVAIIGKGIKEYDWSIPRAEVKNKGIHKYLEYIDQHKEYIFLMANGQLRYYKVHSVWDSPKVGYCSNLIGYRAHFYLGQKKLLDEYGIDDLFEALVTDEKVLSQKNDTIYKYLLEMYHPRITISVVDKVGKLEIVKYRKPVEIAVEEEAADCAVKIVDAVYDGESGQMKLSILDNEKIKYMNIVLEEEIYTFVRAFDEQNVTFNVYLPDRIKENAGNLKVYLLTECDGGYQNYKDVSEIVNSLILNQ